MVAMDEPVFVFGLGPRADHVVAFAGAGEARAYVNSRLFSESLARNVLRMKLVQLVRSQLVIYTISGQPLVPVRTSRLAGRSLIADGPPDDAELQSRLDAYAQSRGLGVPVVDRVALANELMREEWERRRETPPPPVPRWLAKRMPEPPGEPPRIS